MIILNNCFTKNTLSEREERQAYPQKDYRRLATQILTSIIILHNLFLVATQAVGGNLFLLAAVLHI